MITPLGPNAFSQAELSSRSVLLRGGDVLRITPLKQPSSAPGEPVHRRQHQATLAPGVDVLILEGRVADVGVDLTAPPGTPIEDCAGCVVAPGFIDVHVHAVDGAWATGPDPSALRALGAGLLPRGVTGYLATSVTAPLSALADLLTAARVVMAGAGPAQTEPAAACLGVHLEGPWLAPVRAGAQPAEHLAQPNAGAYRELAAGGAVAMVTLAPELDGAAELIAAVLESGAVVAIGHSDATYDEAMAAFAAGARHVTHGFNAMRGLHHREPGLAGAALEAGAQWPVTVEAIADGVHLHPALLRLIHRSTGAEGMCLVSDCVDGDPADLAGGGTGRLVAVSEPGAARRREDGRLAGSTIGLDTCVRVCVEAGIPLVDALVMASRTPAAVLGRDDLGRLEPGARGDVVVLDDSLSVVLVVRDGRVAVRAGATR